MNGKLTFLVLTYKLRKVFISVKGIYYQVYNSYCHFDESVTVYHVLLTTVYHVLLTTACSCSLCRLRLRVKR
jgi:hypothetical protein